MPKKIFMSTDSADLANFSYKGVYVSLTIDTRKWTVTQRDEAGRPAEHDQTQELPIVLRVTKESKRLYLPIGEKYTWNNWLEMCKHEQSTRVRADSEKRANLKQHLAKIKPTICEMADSGTFSLVRLKNVYNGVADDNVTIYSIWDEYIQKKKDDGKAGTARVGRDIRNRFIKDNGMDVVFADIDHSFIQKWATKMKKAGLSTTYTGIVLRSFRTIVNIAINKGFIKGTTKEMFKDSGYNKKASRKHEFLDVPTMRQLYEFWEKDEATDENGNELYIPRDKHALFRDLGLFLFMYLGDGQNLADTLRLEYDGWYFATHGKQLRFYRHKTKERNEDASEVIFPVTPEIKKILDKYANEPKLGQRVFPIMSQLLTPEKEIWVIQRYNKYIRKHMGKVAEHLGMEQRPSPTWARHSFATNLNNSGRVPYKYISDSMGHSSNGDITSNYIGTYPLEKMLEYNAYLLKDPKPEDKKAALLELLKGMSAEERAALMAEASK